MGYRAMIICYMGGTCGDLISAMIDPTDVIIENSKITLTDERQRLKKSYLFSSDHRRDQYLEDIERNTPFFIAVTHRHAKLVKYMIEKCNP